MAFINFNHLSSTFLSFLIFSCCFSRHLTANLESGDFPRFYEDSLDWCQKSLSELIDISQLEKLLNDVFYIDDPNGIDLNGDITFNSLSVFDELLSPDVISRSGSTFGDDFQRSLTTSDERLTRVENEIIKLKVLLGNAMKLDGEQKVTGDITFDNVYLNCGSAGCDINFIETILLNGRNVKGLSSKVIRLDQDQHLIDHFNFSKLVVGDLAANFINNIMPSDIVTRDSDNFINASITFEGPVAVNKLIVPGTINGIRINRQTVLTTTGPQVITSPITFTDSLNVRDLYIEGRLPQIDKDVNTFLSNIVQVDSDRPISGKKMFNTLYVDNLLISGGTINGFNLTDLTRNLLTRDGPQTLMGHVTVNDLIIKGDAWIENINGNRFDEVIVRRDTPIKIKGDKVFSGPVNIRSMEIDGYLNGRPIVNRSLGLLLKSGSQVITGLKVFRNITASKVSVYGDNVGPLKINELEDRMNRMIQGGKNRVLSGPIKLESIKVDGLINGINLTSLMTDYLKVNQPVIPAVHLNISKAIFTKPLKCDSINGLKFPDDFITVKTDQIIKGTTYISNNITVMSSLNISLVNGYPLDAALWDSLTTNGDQNITGYKSINGNVYVKNLYVDKLNSAPMKDLVLLNGDSRTILGNKSFTSVHVEGSSSIKSISGLKSINNIAIDELLSNSINKRDYQSITPQIHVTKLVIPADANINVENLDGLRLNDILRSVVYLRSNEVQSIRGKKQFMAPTTFGNIEFHKTFAGYTRDQFARNYLISEDREIQANVTINADVFVEDNLSVTGKLNELHINQMNSFETKPIFINRPMNFRHARIIGGNVESPTINGIRFAKEMMNRKVPIVIPGDAHFPHGITAKTLTVKSTINNVSISGSMCDPIKDLFSRQYSLTIIGNVTAEAPITANTVNGKAFDDKIVNQMIRRSLKGFKRFKRLVVNGPISLGGRLNNIDPSYLNQNYLSLTNDQTIHSDVILRNVTFSGPVYIGGNLVGQNATINGQDLNKFANMAFRNIDDQFLEGRFTFPRNVIFKKGLISSPLITLNNTVIDLRKDVLRKSRSNRVDSKLIFHHGISTKDVTSSARSNFNRQLRALELLTSPAKIFGRKHFKTLEVDNLVVKTINGIPVSSFLRTDEASEIYKTFIFEKDIEINGNLTLLGTINGLRFDELRSKFLKFYSSIEHLNREVNQTGKEIDYLKKELAGKF
ncbi:uncharacterized protein LOC107369150 [Tetranychus urticae]|uniref:Uncharacterized protein n=1 Tax=Tetranychus urticae TaxID=32264 RepID=T1L0L6_TETUR|nr:uncharacterized protein LOC107369150 [Tetranychus urticae]